MPSVVVRVGYVASLLLACMASMALTFLLVRAHYAAGFLTDQANQEDRLAAENLQSLARQLTQLTAEYLNQSQETGPRAMQDWVSERFEPRLKELRRELLALKAPDLPVAGLLSAVDKAGLMAAQPERADLRVAATEQVLEATAEVDSLLSGLRGTPSP